MKKEPEKFLLTRLSRGATDRLLKDVSGETISTHTPLARRDCAHKDPCCSQMYFYSHASREARQKWFALTKTNHFYSHASREARPQGLMRTYPGKNFYSHASREARRHWLLPLHLAYDFYSHASREARPTAGAGGNSNSRFLLTRLSRGATDLFSFQLGERGDFYSHASREARLISFPFQKQLNTFLLTRLSRGATTAIGVCIGRFLISTHTPLARRDLPGRYKPIEIRNFYSHASREARPGSAGFHLEWDDFYSHASREARPFLIECRLVTYAFLLTRLSRGATEKHLNKTAHE